MTKITLRSLNQKSEFMHSALPSTIPSPLILKFNSQDLNASGDLSNALGKAEVPEDRVDTLNAAKDNNIDENFADFGDHNDGEDSGDK